MEEQKLIFYSYFNKMKIFADYYLIRRLYLSMKFIKKKLKMIIGS